jgi:hypothetical protein
MKHTIGDERIAEIKETPVIKMDSKKVNSKITLLPKKQIPSQRREKGLMM